MNTNTKPENQETTASDTQETKANGNQKTQEANTAEQVNDDKNSSCCGSCT